MTPKRFEEMREEFLTHESKILDWKRGEYSPDEDRLQNFHEVAEFLEQRASKVALVWLLKHIQSIALAVRSGKYAWAWETEGGEGLKQRIADARNYLLLLAACLDEEANQISKQKTINNLIKDV
jgi:predicted house-cleaning noncanonical NTP pyrophosphatase (MazG superfamily)